MEADKFKYRINLCDSQIRQLTLELMDVLTDVNTPDNSDVEGDEVDEPLFLGVRQVLLQVEAIPTRPTAYSELYGKEWYCAKSEKKCKKMKNEIKKNRLAEIIAHPSFVTTLETIRETYPDDGGRQYINSLVACHSILNLNP
jgi:hypothetical protein